MDKTRQAEMKREYKETPRSAGVYMIQHAATGTRFIGSSVNVNARINRHKAEFAFVGNSVPELARDIKAHGAAGLVYEVLDVLDGEYDSTDKLNDDLAALEAMWRERMSPGEVRRDA